MHMRSILEKLFHPSTIGLNKQTDNPKEMCGRLKVRIFSDRTRIRSSLKGFYLSVSNFKYSISVVDSYSNTQKLHFYNVDIHYNFIRQKLTLSISDSIFEQKYKNKFDISNIYFYPIHLHSYLHTIDCRFARRAIYSLGVGCCVLEPTTKYGTP